jgi:choline-glycine betaine transporter
MQAVLGQVAQAQNNVKSPDFDKDEEIERFIRPSRWVKLDAGSTRVLRFNWATSLGAALVLWSFTIAALADPDDTNTEWAKWQSWVSQNFTWLYIATQNIWAGFLIWLYFSRFGNLKLGKADERPQYSDLAWFAMLFCCGIGVGIYYWGVSEPMYYYRAGYSNVLNKVPMDSDDDRAQMAVFMTFFHWGLHGFVVYIVVALALGVVAYRWDMPLTMRSAFYPLLGDLIYSALGDVIDALSIACTTFGVCTSLGFGVASINAGLHRLDNSIEADDEDTKVVICIAITILATCSILLGIDRGIKTISICTFIIGLFLVIFLVFMDNTWFLLNTFTQSLGHYAQWLMQVGWQCDAWQQLSYEFVGGEGNRLWGSQNLGETIATNVGAMSSQAAMYDSHDHRFMEWWTIFYWGWWISWAPFVGTFIARVSRGRTVKQVILGAFIVPTVFCFAWLTVFGALGIKMERVAELTLLNAENAGVDQAVWDAYTADEMKAHLDWMSGSVSCASMGYNGGTPESTQAVALANEGYYALACRSHGDRLFDVMEPYEGMTSFLHVLVVVGVTLYFVTSSDSGSYIDDILAAQGLANPPPIQKIFWAWTECACAIGLIVAGSGNGLSALQAASICAGLPYTFAICFLCTSLYRAFKIDQGEADICASGEFSTGMFDIFDGFTTKAGTVSAGAPPDSAADRWTSLALAIFVPFVPLQKAANNLYGAGLQATAWAAAGQACHLTWIVMLLVNAGETSNYAYLGWTFYVFFALLLMSIRGEMRAKYNVYGSLLEDAWACITMYPWVISQMAMHADSGMAKPHSDPMAQ